MGAEHAGKSVDKPRKGVRWTRMRVLKAFRRDERGQGLLEYGLIILFVALVCVASLNYFGHQTNNSLNNSANTLTNVLS